MRKTIAHVNIAYCKGKFKIFSKLILKFSPQYTSSQLFLFMSIKIRKQKTLNKLAFNVFI